MKREYCVIMYMNGFKMKSLEKAIDAAKSRREKILCDMNALAATPQKPVSPYEIASYAVIPPLFIMAGAMPSSALFIIPVLLPLLYLLFRRLGACLPVACVLNYGLFSLVFNYDVITVVMFCFLLFSIVGLISACQTAPYLLCATVAAVFAVTGATVGYAVVRQVCGKPVYDVAAEYVVTEREDPIIGFFNSEIYENAEIPEDLQKLDKGDDGYDLAAAKYSSETVAAEVKGYAFYYMLHYAGICAAIGYFFAVAINRRTVSPRDDGVTEKAVKSSTRALGGVVREKTPISGMKLPRAFLWTCVAPSLVASIVVDLIGNMESLSATVMHAFVTIPGAFAFFTLIMFFASLFRGRARIAAYIVAGVIAAAMLMFPAVLFFGSMIGVCDCILNLRYWTRYLME